ncbi:hypothetical protein ACVWWG_007601 [Bradyrhizobium sp. LB7.2]
MNENNFNLIRLMAAAQVVYMHAASWSDPAANKGNVVYRRRSARRPDLLYGERVSDRSIIQQFG